MFNKIKKKYKYINEDDKIYINTYICKNNIDNIEKIYNIIPIHIIEICIKSELFDINIKDDIKLKIIELYIKNTNIIKTYLLHNNNILSLRNNIIILLLNNIQDKINEDKINEDKINEDKILGDKILKDNIDIIKYLFNLFNNDIIEKKYQNYNYNIFKKNNKIIEYYLNNCYINYFEIIF